MKKYRLKQEVKDYFKERAGVIFFLVVVLVMSILVGNYTNLDQTKSTADTPNQTSASK